ncbi:MAG TPA: sugar ABC transporter substrate-binding protein [Chloroflexota bacterium]|nr:sugar ABC transporter substrate-binding protein [Chloroflexota bacterium]
MAGTPQMAGGTHSRRRWLMTALGAAAGAPLAAACAGRAEPSTTAPAAGKEPVTIQFAHWGTPDYYERNRQRADDFEKAHPGIKIDILHIQDGFQEKILAMFVADTPPDTHVLDMPKVQAYAKRDVLRSLNPFMREDKSFRAELLHKKAVEIMSDRKGELLGMPSGGSPNLFFYNKDLFVSAGLPTPYELYQKNQWTWQAFLEGARQVTRGSPGAWQVAGATTGLHRLWLNANGIEEFDDYRAPKRCLYGEPPAVEAFQFLADLRHKHKVTPVNFSREVGMDDTRGFVEGRVAMMARWTSGIGQFRNITGFTWGMVPYPKGPGTKGVMANDYATSGTAIAKASKYPQESWAWVKFTANDDGQKIASLAGQGTGVYFSEAANQEVVRQLREISTLETPTMTVDLMKKGNSFVRLLSVDEAEINTLINNNLTPMWNGEDAPPIAARKAADAVNEFLNTNPQ